MAKQRPARVAFTSFSELDEAGIGLGYKGAGLASEPDPEPTPRKERTWGEAATDTVKQLAEGVNTIGGAIPNLVAPQSGVAAFFNDNAQSWRDSQSDVLKQKIADADAAIAKADPDSIWDQGKAALSAYSSDPALVSRFVATNLPSMVPGIGAAKAAQAARLAAGGSAAAAAAAGTTAAGATNAVLNAGGARGDAFEDIRNTLIKQGYSPEEAQRMALDKSLLPAAVGGAAGFLSGKIGLEKAVVGGATKGGLHAGLASAAGEMLGEQVEELTPQLATNYQAGAFDGRPLTRNIGRTAVETAVASGPTSLASGGMTAMHRGLEEGTAALQPVPATEQPLSVTTTGTNADRAHAPIGTQEAISPELAETRLAELEVQASTTGLNETQEAERQTLTERVAVDRAREIEAETVGESVEQASAAPAPSAAATRNSTENQVQDAPASDAAETSGAGESMARTWPQFVLERGERISELKKGTPKWNELKAAWDTIKIGRADQDADGTGSVGEAKAEIQNRDRSRPASVIQMQGMASNPDYLRLGVSRSPESGAPMVFAVGDQASAAVATGRSDTAVMSDGQRVPFQYAVMEASDVQPSNFADGAVNPLFDSAHPGTVKALNNGRTAGLRAAYERGTAENYKRELIADSDMHGIDPAVIEGMKAPMLVRIYAEGDNRTNMGAKSQGQALGLSASEQAATDAALMDNAVVDAFATGALDSAGNRDFARAFIGKLQASGQDVAGMMDSNGALSPAGVTRLQAALVHKAYGDGDLVESLFGSTDNDIRAIGEALKDVAGEWANLRSAVEAGAVNPEVDVTANLLQAIRVVQKARRERGALYDAINQVDVVTGDVLDPLTVGLLRLLYTGHYLTRATGRERLTQSLRDYMARALATSAGGDMFGQQVGPADILNALSGPPAPTKNEPAATQQNQSATPQGEQIASGSDPAGVRADEAGQRAQGPKPDRAGQGIDEAGRRGQGQDAQDPGGQQDREGAQGTGQDGSGTVAPELELSSYAPEEWQARQEAQDQAAAAEANAETDANSKAQADAERDSFALMGSDRAADTLAAQGQAAIFSRSDATAQAYEARIDELFAGERPSLDGVRVLDRSDIFGLFGINEKPVLLAEGKVRAGMKNHPRMTADLWKKVPSWLDNPAAVFESDTVPGRLVVVAPETVGKDQILMVLDPDAVGNDPSMKLNLLINAYDKDGGPPPYMRWLAGGLGRYIDKQKFPTVLKASGLQLPSTALQNKPGTKRILTEKNLSGYRKANPAGEPTLSRGESANSVQDTARVQQVVGGLVKNWTNAPEVVVARDMQDESVPKAVRDYDATMRSEGAEGVPEGFYYQGKVYLVASQLHTPMDVARVLFHETLGHHGLRKVFGNALNPILQQIATQRIAQVKKKAQEYGLDMADPAQRAMAAEEVLAEMAQTHPELGYVKRAVAAIRQWLRKNVSGLAGMQMTDADIIHSFIIPAREFVVRGTEQNSAEAIAATFSRSKGGRAFGTGNDTVVADFVNDQPLKRHPDYKAAKAGDTEAAVRVVRDLVKPESLVQAQDAFGSDVIYVSVHAQEARGKNKLPNALAMLYASSTGADVDQGITQINKAFHTGAGPMERLMNRAEFAGPVSAGRRYVLVDDVTTMGSTLADIAAYIQRNGGQVAGSVVMVNAMRGGKIAPASKTIKQLEARHGQAIREILGVDADQLTGPEAQYLIGFKSADEIRTRGTKARQERVARLDAKALPERQAGVDQQDGDSAGVSDTPVFSRAPLKPSTSGEQATANGTLAQLQAKVGRLIDPSKVDTWLYHWQDKFIDLKRIQEQIKALNGTVSETNDAYRGEELYHKRVAKRTANLLRDEVRPLMKAMNEAGVGIEEFERYLHARHAAEANKAMAERNPSQQELVAKRTAADKTVSDLRNQLQRAQAQGLATTSIQNALGQALIEKADWDSAQAFNGTEEQRLSLSGMSDQEAAKILASYTGDAKKAIEDLGARVDKMNEGTLRTLDDYGLMDKSTLNAWRNEYKHYVPLHRDEANPDSKAHPIGQGFSTKGAAAKKRTGSNEKVTNILSHIVMQREAALTRGEKNNVVKRLYLLAAQNPDESLWSLDLPKKKQLDPDTGLVRTMVDQTARLRDNVVTFRVGGKDKYLVFNDRNERAARLALAVKNMDATELDWLSRTMGSVTRWLAAVNTQYNPVFSVFNIIRDLQGASLQLSDTKLAGKQKEVLANIAKNTGKIWTELRRERKEDGVGTGPWAQLMEQFQLDGGTTGFRELYSDPADRLKALKKELRNGEQGAASKGAHFALGVLSDFNETLEMTTRLATYKVALDNGLSRQEAASLAKNITVNFNRKGRVTSVLGSHYAFLNAAIQGNARLLQTMKGPAGRKIAVGGVGLGVMMGLMGQLMMGGGDGADDEWKKIPEFVKERNIIIPLSRTQYVTIPMPLGFHVLPNLGRKMVDAAFHNDPTVSRAKYLGDMAAIALNAYNPFGGADNVMQMFTPTWADPAIALATNKDWMGKSIFKEVRDINHPTPGHTRVKDSTALPYRWAARGINAITGGSEWEQGAISPTPEAIQYLMEQAFGGVLREANKLGATATSAVTGEELAPNQWFLLGRLYGNTTGINGQSSAYHENVKRINVGWDEAKTRVDRGEDADAVLKEVPLAKAHGVEKAADKRVTELTKLRRKVQASEAPDKKEQVKAINKEIEVTMRLLNQAVADVLEQAS